MGFESVVGGSLAGMPEGTRQRLMRMVERGSLHPGDRLGAERELAIRLGVSRSVLRQALAFLEADGVLRRVPGRGGGTFLAPAKVDRHLSQVVGVPSLLRDQGFTAGTRVISVGVAPAELDAAEALGLSKGDFVVSLVRMRLADGIPLSLENAVLPAKRVPGLPERDLSGSLYELLDSGYGIRPEEATEHIEVTLASPDEATILDTSTGSPLILITRTTVDSSGEPFEYSRDLFRSDRMRISVKVHGSPSPEKAQLRGRVMQVMPKS